MIFTGLYLYRYGTQLQLRRRAGGRSEKAPAFNPPIIKGGTIYFGSNDGKVYAVSLEEGEQVWAFQTESTVQSTVVRYEDSVIFTSDGGSTCFLSPEGAEQHRLANPVWHRDSFWYSFPALKRDAVHLSTCANRRQYWEFTYYAYDRKTGELMWKHRDQSCFGEGGINASGLFALFTRNLKLLNYMAPSLWRNLAVYTSGDAVVRAFNGRTGTPKPSSPKSPGGYIIMDLKKGIIAILNTEEKTAAAWDRKQQHPLEDRMKTG